MRFISTKRLSEQVHHQLFDAILRGELSPGLRIREGSLARELGVAQGTLREALQQLEHQGLVEKSNRRGTFVTKLSTADVADIYRVRTELEPLAAALAHERMAPQDLAQLKAILTEMKDASREKDLVERCRLDLSFHQLIWSISGNAWLEKALTAVCPPLFASSMLRAAKGFTYDYDADDVEHETLLNILASQDGTNVQAEFRTMIEVFGRHDLEHSKTTGIPDDSRAK